MRVSDHAIVRYLERRYNLNIDDIKEEIFPKRIRGMVAAGAVKYTVNGMEFVVVDGVIVTSVPRGNTGFKSGHQRNKNKREKNGNRKDKNR